METIILAVHVALSLGIIGLVLLQRGKGAEAGAALGGGASATVFGASGASNFLSRSTAILATAFFISSLFLAYLASQREGPESVIEPSTSVVTEQKVSDMPETGLPVTKPGSDIPAAE